MASSQAYTGKRLTTGTTTIKTGSGVLGAININKALSGTVTVTDGSVTIAVLTNGTTAPLGTVFFGGSDGGMAFGTNLVVALSATEDITILFR